MKRMITLALASLMVFSMFTGCTPKKEDTTKKDEPKTDAPVTAPKTEGKVRTDIVVGWKSDVVNPDPQKMNDTVSQRVIRMIFDRLVAIDENEKPVPGLAEKWEQVSPTEYKFFIRKGVKFHNGDELKASDVKFSLDRARESSFTKAFAGAISEVTILDDYTVSVKTQAPYAPLITNLSLEHCSIVPEKVVKEKGDDFKLNPIGTGPMKFKSWKPNNAFVVDRNEEYWGEKAKATSVTGRVIPEDTSRTISLETGEIDIDLDAALVDLKRVKENKELQIHEQPGVSPVYLCFNQEKAPVSDLKVRQAMAYAINRQAIVDVVFEGYGEVANSEVPPAMIDYYHDKVAVYDYQPEMAKKLLTEGGYPSGVNIELAVGTEERNRMAQLIQADCAQVGITIDISVLEWGAFLDYVAKPEYQAMILGVSNRRDPEATFFPNFHSKNIGAAGNRARYNNPTTDQLIDSGRAEMDHAKRTEIYHQIQDALHNDCVWQPLATKKNFVTMRKGVEGVHFSAVECHDVYNATVTE